MGSMFKAHDIRAKSEVLTAEVKNNLYSAIVCYIRESLKCKSVVICRDARLAAPEIAEGLCTCLTSYGTDVFLNPLPVSTCQFYFSCMQHPDSAGLMITASHNPGNYIGIKIVGPMLEPIAYCNGPDGGIKKIEENYLNKTVFSKSTKGKCTVINYLDRYIDYTMRLAGVFTGSLSGMNLLLEFFGGSGGTEISLAFQRSGANIFCRNIIPDGYFRQGDPNPIIESSVAPTRKEMQNGNYDLGFCFDGDADRMDLMFPDGSQIIPGLNMSVIAPYLMSVYKGIKKDFYVDPKTNPVSISKLEQAGCNVKLIKNGHSSIKAKMKENPSFFGAVEESAHYYLNLPFDISDFSKGFAQTESSLFFALLCAKSMKEKPESYQEIKRIQNSIYRVREWSVNCENNSEIIPVIAAKVTSRMKELGATVIEKMEDGTPLESTLMRFNVPDKISKETEVSNWAQVSQRISASEDAVIKWEICASNEETCQALFNEINACCKGIR